MVPERGAPMIKKFGSVTCQYLFVTDIVIDVGVVFDPIPGTSCYKSEYNQSDTLSNALRCNGSRSPFVSFLPMNDLTPDRLLCDRLVAAGPPDFSISESSKIVAIHG